jgi:Leucine-rich repeat (LRR) protein
LKFIEEYPRYVVMNDVWKHFALLPCCYPFLRSFHSFTTVLNIDVMADDAPADDLIINDALVKRVLMFGRGRQASLYPFWLRMHNGLLYKLYMMNRSTEEQRTPDLYGRWLKFSKLSDDERKNLRDKQVIDIIDYNFNKADEVNDSKKADAVITIYLSGCDGITDATLDHIATNCTNLDKLEVSGCDQITDDGIKAIVEKIGNKLTYLDYSGCTRCTDAALQAIVQHCPNLRVLNADNTGITQIPESIAYGMLPKLRRLNLRKNKIETIPLRMIRFFIENIYYFHIDDNPLIEPPLQTVQQGMKAIVAYSNEKQGLPRENEAGGVNDSPTFDPDRLGVSVYAESISTVAEKAETPKNSFCVAIFGRWGAGKTFLYKLIRQAKKAKADEMNRKRLQELQEERKLQNIFLRSNERSLQFICNLIALVSTYRPNCIATVLQFNKIIIAALVAFPLYCPIWICMYLTSLPLSFYIELFRLIEKKIEEICSSDWKKICLWFASLPITLPGLLFLGARGQSNIQEFFCCLLPQQYILLVQTITKNFSADTDALPPWRDVRDILTGNVPLHSQTFFDDNSSAILQVVVLSVTQPIFKFMLQSRWNPIISFWSSFSRNRQFKVNHEMTKSIDVTCTAWLYNGTDVLWAAILEEMWMKVEAEYGTNTVRFHRFRISISGESKSDDPKVKESKRKTALIKMTIKVICYVVLSTVITIFSDDIATFSKEQLFKDNLEKIYLILPASLYTIPAIPLLKDSIKLFLQLIGKSQGAKIFQQAQALGKHKRFDFKEKTGFMGIVKNEVEYLYDFLITVHIVDWKHQVLRPGRINIMLDDLDRCDPETIMSMLEAAMLLLLIDAPVTCWIPIDSQFIVASIEKKFGQQFLQEGIDGYSFLEKIIQLPFCIPDLDNHRKVAFFEKIFEKDELSPCRLCERLLYLDEKAGLEEFRDLLPNKQRFLTKDKVVLVPEGLSPEELVPVLQKMIDEVPGIFNKNEDIEACFDSPSEVLEKVKRIYFSKRALEGKLEEEFLNFVSVGIEKLLVISSSRLPKEGAEESSQDRASEPPPNPVSSDDKNNSSAATGSELGITNTPPTPASFAAPSSASLAEEATDTPFSPYDNMPWYKDNYHPIMNPLERSWFKKYADYFVGKPRKMKRIMNSYMVSRIVAKKLRPNLASQKEFGEKLLKLIILCEQWPYRMAWFLVVAENIQQEKSLQDQRCIESQNPVGDTLTNIISKSLVGRVPEKGIMDLPLLTVYHNLVQSVIHSPETADSLLQRDGDPQVFEILLAKLDAQLRLKDVASSSSSYDSTPQSTVRPYLFNLQMHMTDKIQNYIDNCMVHLVENKSNKMNHVVYQKKPDFFNQEYPTPSPVEIVEANKAKNSKADLHERSLRSEIEIAQLEADDALREREIRMEEFMKAANTSANLIQIFKEDFDKAKEVSDEKNARLQAAKIALVKFQSGITVNE